MSWQNYYALKKGNKYHNSKVIMDGQSFQSRKEARRYAELKMMQSAGFIHGLQRQKKYVLIPAQREPDTIGARGGKHKGQLIEHEVAYYADFVYYDRDGREVVEDVKSPATRTEVYKVKRKLMLYVHGIRIIEV